MTVENPAGGQERPDPSGEGEQNATVVADATPCPKTGKIKLSDIAADWGTSVAYVSKMKKEGCPVHTLEAARQWRQGKGTRGSGYRSKPISEGEENATEPAEEVFVPPPRQRGGLKNIKDSLQGAIEMEEEAKYQVELAIAKKEDSRLPNLIAAYNKARDGRYDAEQAVLDLMERQKVLVPLAEAKKIWQRVMGTLFSRLRGAPRRAAPRANPGDDILAEEAFSKAIEEVIAEVHSDAALFT